jgi:hypothetical protein
MDNQFFERPILNSPYSYPERHWELDSEGQPTQKIIEGVQKTPEAARMAFAMGRENWDWLYAARPPAGSGEGLKWQTWQTFAIPKSRLSFEIWWTRGDSNPRLPRCERGKSKLRLGATVT